MEPSLRAPYFIAIGPATGVQNTGTNSHLFINEPAVIGVAAVDTWNSCRVTFHRHFHRQWQPLVSIETNDVFLSVCLFPCLFPSICLIGCRLLWLSTLDCGFITCKCLTCVFLSLSLSLSFSLSFYLSFFLFYQLREREESLNHQRLETFGMRGRSPGSSSE